MPRGTLYAAVSPVGAFIEVFRGVPLVAQAELDARLLATVRVPDERRLADAPLPAPAGFAGIRYRVSHDPSARQIGVALFGDEGVDATLTLDQQAPIPPDVVDEVRRRFGILVLPTPS